MKILFQGDSITDAGRDRSDPHNLGPGYVKYAAEFLRERHPDVGFEFVNLGVSGDRTRELLGRWDTDCVAVQPDVISIMIGINDCWRAFDANDPMTAEEFEANYRRLLDRVTEETEAKILLIEPYLLPVDSAKDAFRADLDPKIHVVRKLAHEYADAFLPTDGLLAAACVPAEPSTWSADGIHPNAEGAKLIGEYVANVLDNLLD